MKKEKSDIKATKEDESAELADIPMDFEASKKADEVTEISEISIEPVNAEQVTQEGETEYFEPPVYEEKELIEPTSEYPEVNQDELISHNPSDELQEDPEDEKDYFYQRKIAKSYKILHPNEPEN